MRLLLPLASGLMLVVLGWALPQRVAKTHFRTRLALLLDLAIPLLGWIQFASLSARPIFSGAAIFMLCATFAMGDRAKRAILFEPVVYSDLPQFVQLFRHPKLTVPYGATTRAAIGAALASVLFLALFMFEPALWHGWPWPGLIFASLVVASGFAVTRPPLLSICSRILRKLGPTGDPASDAELLGPLAILVIYALIARAERAALRDRATATPLTTTQTQGGPPIVVVQCESFFDARHMHPAVQNNLLPAYDACRRSSMCFGRLSVPGWGANTTRTEFAALTGIPENALGFDRFNPYHAFARAPVASLAWAMRAKGYRTVCIHPFDRAYFRRDKVMPNLGFDEFLAKEAFGPATRIGPYVADHEVAKFAIDLLRTSRAPLFIFAITMENHGPWGPGDPRGVGHDPMPAAPPLFNGDQSLKCYLRGLQSADAMIGILKDELEANHPQAVLAVYGDHLPSLPDAFRQLGFTDKRTDYFIWGGGRREAVQRDLCAHDLPHMILSLAESHTANVRRNGGMG